jgi:hypothetical protein
LSTTLFLNARNVFLLSQPCGPFRGGHALQASHQTGGNRPPGGNWYHRNKFAAACESVPVSSPADRHAPRDDARADDSNIDSAEFDAAKIANHDRQIDWPGLEQIVHCDPAGRGLASFRRAGAPLDADQLRAAALHLARRASAVGIVTGFCAVVGHRVTAETDGPPGALFLARALAALNIDVVLISDRYGTPLLAEGCDLWKLDRNMVVEFPFADAADTDRWIGQFFSTNPCQRLSHLVSIERPGPSHTLESLAAQPRATPPPTARFESEVPPKDRDVCHSMRGQSIDAATAKTHRLFQWIAEHRLDITTIGIGDGGNELGMGSFAWELLVDAIGPGPLGRIACRIATDITLLAGVSDWAAYTLALAVARLRGAQSLGRDWTAAGQRELIETLVQSAGAVDGLTLRPEPTVDGLPLDDYLQPLEELRHRLGYSDSDGTD